MFYHGNKRYVEPERLEQYYNQYKADLKKIEYELYKENRKEISISGSNFEINGDRRPEGYMSNNIEKQIINKSDKVSQLEDQKRELEYKIGIIDSALMTLKSTDRQAIEMRFFKKMEYNEISTKLGITKIEQKIYNAIKKMEKIFC